MASTPGLSVLVLFLDHLLELASDSDQGDPRVKRMAFPCIYIYAPINIYSPIIYMSYLCSLLVSFMAFHGGSLSFLFVWLSDFSGIFQIFRSFGSIYSMKTAMLVFLVSAFLKLWNSSRNPKGPTKKISSCPAPGSLGGTEKNTQYLYS